VTLDVIVVSYRSAELVGGCVEAALAFAGERARVVLVDNLPGDGAREAVLAHAPQATVIENDRNVGYAFAVNQAITASAGELVLLLNPDITSIRGSYETLERAFAADSTLAAVTPRLVASDGKLEPTCRREPRPFDLVAETLDLAARFPHWQRPKRFRMLSETDDGPRRIDAATGACLFLRRTALDDVGPFDESFFLYWEETDWLVRAARQGWHALYLPVVEAVHIGRRSTDVSSETLSLLLLESQHVYARKHFGQVMATALRGGLVTIDLLRWARGLRPDGAERRARMARRIRVHVTGRAPAVAGRRTRAKAKSMGASYAIEATVEHSAERLRKSEPE
jgi:N-acetylglucosaminyl-diphospho-decaprenol L-rhamnosyltransferase